MEVLKTGLEGVLLINLDVFRDHRGEYVETYNEELYRRNGIDVRFVQDDISVSVKNVLRGIHSDAATWKLISCPWGEIYLVIVNCAEESANFGRWQAFTLSDGKPQPVLAASRPSVPHLAL